jgi:hypothetical protein
MSSARKALTAPAPVLVVAMLRAARDLTKHRRPPYWIPVDTLMERLATKDREPVDRAIRYAVRHKLFKAIGRSPKTVVVTADGVRLAKNIDKRQTAGVLDETSIGSKSRAASQKSDRPRQS